MDPLLSSLLETGASSVVADTNIHDYKSLDSDQIRLIEVLPRKWDENGRIRCRTHIRDLKSQPKFIALSYTWGSPPAQHAIQLNGEEFFIRKNLWRFLSQVRELPRFAGEWFWIDAICINQSDTIERTHQVSLMSQIYKNAHEVLVWLGPAYGDSDGVMQYFAKPGKKRKPSNALKIWSQPIGKAISEICARPYWKRLWIFQELLLAQQIEIMCGNKVIRWNSFQELLWTTHHTQLNSRLEGKLAYLNARDSPATTIVIQYVRDVEERSLLSLIFATQKLRCAEIRDKVYGLLGIATTGHSGIAADYNVPVEILLNNILREHHKIRQPANVKEVLGLWEDLSKVFGIDPGDLYHLHDGYPGLISIPSGQELAFVLDHLKPPTENRSLFWAVFYNHTSILKIMARDSLGAYGFGSAFRRAIEYGYVNVVKVLLRVYAYVLSVSSIISDTLYELDCMTSVQDPLPTVLEILEILLPLEQIDINASFDDGCTVLHIATIRSTPKMVIKLLESRGLDVNKQDISGETALHRAIYSKSSVLTIAALVQHGKANVNIPDYRGRTPLNEAAAIGKASAVDALLSVDGIDVNTKDEQGRSALFNAISYDNESIAMALLQVGGIDINARDSCGQTAFLEAVVRNHESIFMALLHTPGIDIHAQNDKGRTALHLATHKVWSTDSKRSMLNVVLETGEFDVNLQDHDGNTALHSAAHSEECFIALLESGSVDVNKKNTLGQTALYLAVAHEHKLLIATLLSTPGIQVDIQNNEGETALHEAAYRGNIQIARMLLDVGKADASMKCCGDMLVLDYAALWGQEEFCRLLTPRLGTTSVITQHTNA